uniref:Eukaryotic translation initiation factor 4E n=2 Tax=Eucampia antarctica TaxID=49252 RepID=A0A6U0SXB6_9STRA|mmetsp:Transcript_30512/g.29410  ORF Transcript_30512/g.29410 Transcript_30512/m.29410 type:complete len:169 (+) Transcript_30512:379-885(+)|eukprot:CAMPEP_0197840162 /NCGR_PEP_ID=MMETSP1437-20131217/45443_1 /TAXON_ID=49252 ORGANISM="Eucampia antarctica, Strain CCMP1452" /NCGR_SAMPLE_ID=MMETSP1437 /ASSEMBLY_ACC=CAM_ASM_001096 /LENGTH=168 /DNA_ID=CAMNT_0043449721 /DNA_START=550 /DNA_END=1056 /DNA_ORIENTATION=-
MKPLCSFSTIEDFWRYFNHLPKPSEVFFDGEGKKIVGNNDKVVEEYSLFKKGIEPEWGDVANKSGGEWFFRSHLESDVLNMYWQNMVMGVIGEAIEDGSDDGNGIPIVNGIRVVDKGKQYPMFRLEIWLSTKEQNARDRIRSKLIEVVTDGLPTSRKGSPKFEWKDHS